MLRSHVRSSWVHLRPWLPAVVVGVLILVVVAQPAPLVPIARAYAALCAQYPILALVSNHTPPMPLALLLSLAALALVTGGVRRRQQVSSLRFTGIAACGVGLMRSRPVSETSAPSWAWLVG